MKYFISEETGSIYWFDGKAIMCTPMNQNNIFNTESEDICEVEEHMMKDELTSTGRKLEEVYAEVRKALNN